LKPIDESGLQFAIEKYQNLKKGFSGIDTSVLNSILKQLNPSGGTAYKNRFIIKSGEHIRSLKVEEIDFFVSQDKITFAVTKSGRKHIIDYNMDQVEEDVDPVRFFRINRKYIISIDGFADIIAYSNHRLKVQLNNNNTMEAIVSRNRVKEFKEWLDR
jgi:DNA-binding LytR/AlgR family response regulator